MGGSPVVVQERLRYPGALAVGPMLRFLAAHAVPGVERHDAAARRHTRLVPAPNGPALVHVTFPGPDDDPPEHRGGAVLVACELADAADRDQVLRRVRGWLDLATDPDPVDRHLAHDPLLAPLVAQRPGLRVPGSVDGVETALLAVLGQQVSLAAARTFAARLLGELGEPGPGGLHRLRDPAVLAEAGPERLQRATGVTHARARTLHAVATACADGLRLDTDGLTTDGLTTAGPDADQRPDADRLLRTRRALLALPGIGPWTADYVALRCLRDPDAYLGGDLVLRRVLGVGTAREAEQRAEPWRPYRGYALLHLWTAAVFA
ncbi:DNA-3-methyladenine glycosylase family protein [Jannaschia sp. R86511]|uniref:DNA-3-methyladenine glycosylase family protein n=1 Tax=Jannaschia sp. R86511 TaxID=3093853 RepID=UPI0036D34B68